MAVNFKRIACISHENNIDKKKCRPKSQFDGVRILLKLPAIKSHKNSDKIESKILTEELVLIANGDCFNATKRSVEPPMRTCTVCVRERVRERKCVHKLRICWPRESISKRKCLRLNRFDNFLSSSFIWSWAFWFWHSFQSTD